MSASWSSSSTSSPSPETHAEERPDLALWRAEDGFPEGETLGEFQSRVSAVIEDLAREHDGRTVAIVTHAGVIEASIRSAYGLPSEADWVAESEVENASITELWHWPRGRHALGAPTSPSCAASGTPATSRPTSRARSSARLLATLAASTETPHPPPCRSTR